MTAYISFVNLPCGHVMSHKKFGPDRFSRFDVYWIQTNKQTNKQTDKQTDRQAKFIYRLSKLQETKKRKYIGDKNSFILYILYVNYRKGTIIIGI